MIIGKNNLKTTDFKLTINHNLINLENNVKYLGVHLDTQMENFLNNKDKLSSNFHLALKKIRGYYKIVSLYYVPKYNRPNVKSRMIHKDKFNDASMSIQGYIHVYSKIYHSCTDLIRGYFLFNPKNHP